MFLCLVRALNVQLVSLSALHTQKRIALNSICLSFSLSPGTENQLVNEDFIDEDHASPALLHQFESDFLKSRTLDDHSYGDSQPSSLFGEVHMNEIKKLEKSLEMSESEKSQLHKQIQEAQSAVDSAKAEYSAYQGKWKKVLSSMNSLFVAHLNNQIEEIDDQQLLKEIEEFEETKELGELLDKFVHSSALGKLRDELKAIVQQLDASKAKCNELASDTTLLNTIAEEVQALLVSTEEELINLSEEMSAIYYQVCDVNGETPSRIMLDHASSSTKNNEKTSINLKLERLKNQLSESGASSYLQKWKTISNDSDSKDSIAVLKSQIKHLKTVIDLMIETRVNQKADQATSQSQAKSMVSASPSVQSIAELSANPEEVKQIVEENKTNKALLATKREQIATLRMVIKANKQTAEIALENLKLKYEKEKQLNTETMSKMKVELKALKEDAATFASLRSMFAARCEEYVTQNDELERRLQASEDEKKTINHLLRMAIQQKLSLTQKLEDYDMERDRERLTGSASGGSVGANNANKPNNSRAGGQSRRPVPNNTMSFAPRNFGSRLVSMPGSGGNHSTPKMNNNQPTGLNSTKRNF